MKEREISLSNLIFEILLKWRMIIVAMVIGGVLFGGYSYWQSTKALAIQNKQSNTEITIEDLENTLTIAQKSNVKAALGYERYSEYYGESLLMQIDAQNMPTVELIYGITTGDTEVRNIVVDTYERLLSGGLVHWLVQNGMTENEAAWVSELVRTEKDMEDPTVAVKLADKGSLYVSIVHKDEDSCKTLAKQVKEFLLSQKAVLEDAIGTHEMTLISDAYAKLTDSKLATQQRTAFANATSGNITAANLKNAFSAQEKQYYVMLKENVTSVVGEEATSVSGGTQSPSVSPKYVMLGMVLFAFLSVFYAFVAFFLNNKLRANDDFDELYEILQLGVVTKTNPKKKILGFVDSWIIALRDKNKRRFTPEEAKEIVAVTIKMAVKKSESKEVSLLGCDVKKQTWDICNSIKEILEKENIKVSILDNVLYNAEEMGKLADIVNAVIIEKTGVTMYDEIEKELELLNRYNINILGGVLID